MVISYRPGNMLSSASLQENNYFHFQCIIVIHYILFNNKCKKWIFACKIPQEWNSAKSTTSELVVWKYLLYSFLINSSLPVKSSETINQTGNQLFTFLSASHLLLIQPRQVNIFYIHQLHHFIFISGDYKEKETHFERCCSFYPTYFRFLDSLICLMAPVNPPSSATCCSFIGITGLSLQRLVI